MLEKLPQNPRLSFVPNVRQVPNMRYLITTILLALAPLSWGYTFDDGTKFKDPLSTYTFLSCASKDTVPQIYYALSIKGAHGYIAFNDTLRWSMMNTISVYDNEIRLTGWLLNRTTLTLQSESRNLTLSCELSDQTEAAAGLTRLRAKRQI